MGDALYYLRASPYFEGISATQAFALAKSSELRHYEPGDIVTRAGLPATDVICCVEGSILLYRKNSESGATLALGLLEAPSIFGDAECSVKSPWLCSARAETAAVCVRIPFEALCFVLEANAQVAARLYYDASRRHLLANYTAQMATLYSPETRLLRALIDFAEAFGAEHDDRFEISRDVSLNDLAAVLGVTKKTVQRAISTLEAEQALLRDPKTKQWIVRKSKSLWERVPADGFGLFSSGARMPRTLLKSRV